MWCSIISNLDWTSLFARLYIKLVFLKMYRAFRQFSETCDINGGCINLPKKIFGVSSQLSCRLILNIPGKIRLKKNWSTKILFYFISANLISIIDDNNQEVFKHTSILVICNPFISVRLFRCHSILQRKRELFIIMHWITFFSVMGSSYNVWHS